MGRRGGRVLGYGAMQEGRQGPRLQSHAGGDWEAGSLVTEPCRRGGRVLGYGAMQEGRQGPR